MRRGLARQRLVAVFLTAALLFNYPLLSLFDRPEAVFGFPMVYVFMFAVWGAVIAVIAWTVERGMR
ncbi:hypothetical protein ACKVEX_15930 [Rhodocyclaceae bacterium SMB388]